MFAIGAMVTTCDEEANEVIGWDMIHECTTIICPPIMQLIIFPIKKESDGATSPLAS